MSSQGQRRNTEEMMGVFDRASTASVAGAAAEIQIEDFNFSTLNPSNSSPKNTHFLASAIAHGLDGWEYLGMALMSHLHGRHIIAFHLAYYAQLRAAKSLLCCNGIYLEGSIAYVLKESQYKGEREQLSGAKGPHEIIWEMHNKMPAESWIDNVFGFNILEFIKDVTDGMVGDEAVSKVIQKLKQQLGRESAFSDKTKFYRNHVSYQAQSIIKGENTAESIDDKYEFAKTFWATMSPDIAIKLILISEILRSLKRYVSRSHLARYKLKIESALQDHGIDQGGIEWITRGPDSEDGKSIQFWALQEDILMGEDFSKVAPHYVQCAISRGALLLQIASDACKDRIGDSQNAKSVVHEVAELFGEKRALWEDSGEIERYADLYIPITSYFDDGDGGDDARKWTSIQKIAALGCERIALWLLMPDDGPES